MTEKLNCPVQVLFDETNDAFAAYSNVNADYAIFAAMAINEFKTALKYPALTEQQLRRAIRQADREHRAAAGTRNNWSAFMASYVSKSVNTNLPENIAIISTIQSEQI